MEIATYRYTLDDFKRERLLGQKLTRASLRKLRKRRQNWFKQLIGTAIALAIAIPCIIFLSSQSGSNLALGWFVIIAPAIGLTTVYHRLLSAYFNRELSEQAEVFVSADSDNLHLKCDPLTTTVSRSSISGYRIEPLDIVISLSNNRIIQIPLRGVHDLPGFERWLSGGAP